MECKTHEFHNDFFTIEQMGDEVFELQKTFNKHFQKKTLKCSKLKKTSMIICSTMEAFEAWENFNDQKGSSKFQENMSTLFIP